MRTKRYSGAAIFIAGAAALLVLGFFSGAASANLVGFSGFAAANTNGQAGSPSDTYGGGATTFTLTSGNGAGGEATSGFATAAQNIQSFTASFTYQATNLGGCCGTGADGITFVLQNDSRGDSALGGAGGALGYGGNGGPTTITPSAAIELNIFTNSPPTGVAGESFQTDGGIPANGSYNSSSPINLRSGDPINVSITYDGTTLREKLTDPTAGTIYSNSYLVNLPSLLGANSALVGFTGGDGGATSQQVVSNFSFTVPEPTCLGLICVCSGLALAHRRPSARQRKGD